jgi:hypothetical protein
MERRPHVPYFIRWPGKITAGKTQVDGMMGMIDGLKELQVFIDETINLADEYLAIVKGRMTETELLTWRLPPHS